MHTDDPLGNEINTHPQIKSVIILYACKITGSVPAHALLAAASLPPGSGGEK